MCSCVDVLLSWQEYRSFDHDCWLLLTVVGWILLTNWFWLHQQSADRNRFVYHLSSQALRSLYTCHALSWQFMSGAEGGVWWWRCESFASRVIFCGLRVLLIGRLSNTFRGLVIIACKQGRLLDSQSSWRVSRVLHTGFKPYRCALSSLWINHKIE